MSNIINVNLIKRNNTSDRLYPIVATLYYNQVSNTIKGLNSGTTGISSVTNNGTGLFTAAFTTVHSSSTSYIFSGSAAETAGDQPGNMFVMPRLSASGLFSKLTSSCAFAIENIGGAGTKQILSTYHIQVCFVGTYI